MLFSLRKNCRDACRLGNDCRVCCLCAEHCVCPRICSLHFTRTALDLLCSGITFASLASDRSIAGRLVTTGRLTGTRVFFLRVATLSRSLVTFLLSSWRILCLSLQSVTAHCRSLHTSSTKPCRTLPTGQTTVSHARCISSAAGWGAAHRHAVM